MGAKPMRNEKTRYMGIGLFIGVFISSCILGVSTTDLSVIASLAIIIYQQGE